jgi:hypothetical protein
VALISIFPGQLNPNIDVRIFDRKLKVFGQAPSGCSLSPTQTLSSGGPVLSLVI